MILHAITCYYMILHDITWYYMQKLYSYNLTIKTSIYSKLAGHDQNKTSPVPCSNHRTASWRPSLVRWMASPRLPIMANGYQKKTPEKYHPTSSNIIQHHPTSSNISTNSSSSPSAFVCGPVAFASLLRSQWVHLCASRWPPSCQAPASLWIWTCPQREENPAGSVDSYEVQ